MKKANFKNPISKLATVDEARERYRLSRNKLMEIAAAEDAVRKFGRSVRVDVQILDSAIRNY